MTHQHLRRPAVLLVIAALAALCLAACGSSSNTSSTSSNSAASAAASGGGRNRAARTKLVACLKAHGVTLPARRPGAGGGYGGPPPGSGGAGAPGARGYGGGGPGFFGGGGAGRFSNPKFRAAFQACGGRAFGGARRAQFSKTAITKFVACVKQHGYTLPKPNFSGGPIFPVSVERNATFQAASKSCASLLRPSGAPPAGGGAPAPSGSASGGGSTTS